MTHDPLHPENAPDEPLPLTKSPTLMDRWRRAFGRAAPGGASSTPSPTQGRTSGPVLLVGAAFAFRVTGWPVWLIAASLISAAVSVGFHLAFVRLHRKTA